MPETVKLTTMAKAAGCAAKLSPSILDSVLRTLPKQFDPNVLVGYETSDDAGVYRLSPDLAIVQTTDFFTPIVDDPFLFGQIAAANALSDVYAMGGRPISSLSLVGFPERGDVAVLGEIMRGGQAKMTEAGCFVIGGHSIRDDDLKFGYAVTGVVHPDKIWRNVGARPGDVLLFTKALGTGVIATALKKGTASEESVAAATASMTQLNRAAAEALTESDAGRKGIHAVTDVTGFSLLGHAREMALGHAASNIPVVSLEIDHARIEYLPGAVDCARAGNASGGLHNNRNFIGDCVVFADTVPEEFRLLLFDPQTSGGLLVAIGANEAPAALEALLQRGIPAREIGRVVEKRSPLISIS
ncbi:MAG TPA: selenide, water dikinase SelD [Candidatus Limnocylindrales bacterium]|nr:selenide, water dikinase SelD [Candidatus Limnocylindrales bacterium]